MENLSLSELLDTENLGEFEKRKAQLDFHPNPLACHELFNANQDKSKLASCPPVKLYVSKIPPELNITGLRNIFSPYGQLRDVSHPKIGYNGHGQSEFRFAFVSFSNTTEALKAIEALSQRHPLYLEVKLSRDEQEAYRKRHLEEEMEKLRLKMNGMEEEEEEEDWDQEIAERERMEASVARFMEDEVGREESDGEIRALESSSAGAGKNGAIQRVSVAQKDDSGMEIYVEADLPETDLKRNSLADILGETPSDCRYFIYHKTTNPSITTFVSMRQLARWGC